MSFKIIFEGSVKVDRSRLREFQKEGPREFQKGGPACQKTTRDESNIDLRLGEEIEGGRAKLTRWSVRM